MTLRRLTILTFPESQKLWTARCLEHDVAAGGRSIQAATDTLIKVLRAHIAYDRRHGREPLSAFANAPQSYWRALDASMPVPGVIEVEEPAGVEPIRVAVAMFPRHPVLDRPARPLPIP